MARVRAESLQFMSEPGTSRGVLTLVDGEPVVGPLGMDSRGRGYFFLGEGIPQLTLSDGAGSKRATLALIAPRLDVRVARRRVGQPPRFTEYGG